MTDFIIDWLAIQTRAVKKIVGFFRLMVFMLVCIHTLACIWIRLGLAIEGSWIDVHEGVGEVLRENKVNMYIAALYWTITTLSTVGYGDLKGYTPREYLFQIVLQFIGIGYFSFFMSKVQEIMTAERQFNDIVADKIEDLDWWISKLDKARSDEQIPAPLYYSIRQFVKISLVEDNNLIIKNFDMALSALDAVTQPT